MKTMTAAQKQPLPPPAFRAALRGLFGVVCAFGIISAFAQTPAPAALNRELIFLKPGAGTPNIDTSLLMRPTGVPPKELPPRTRAIAADSAKVLSPAPRSVITACPAIYEIEPMLRVDSALLFARHSGGVIETLAVLSAPPYRAAWECAGAPDQDPAHLQFGYVLYVGDTLAIASPPMPHIWALLRGKRARNNGLGPYRVKRIAAVGGFEVDCDFLKWEAAGTPAGMAASNGANAMFKMLWTGAKLHFIARVRDSTINSGDFVELHLDMRRDRAAFPGIDHRSLRFSPRGRSIFFVGGFADGKYAPSDSVAALLADETEWKASVDSEGYTVEAAIPLSLLSGLDFPPSNIGFDVSVTDVGDGEESFISWAGAPRFARYSPGVWATARMDRASPALRYVLLFAIFVSGFAILGFVAYLFFSHRQEGKELKAEAGGASPVTDAVIEEIEKQLQNANLRAGDISRSINKSTGEIDAALMRDLGCTFERQLEYKRIKHSQKLMREPEMTIEEIAKRSGFADVDAYRKSYAAQMKVAPEVSREAMLERVREDLEAENEDGDDGALRAMGERE